MNNLYVIILEVRAKCRVMPSNQDILFSSKGDHYPVTKWEPTKVEMGTHLESYAVINLFTGPGPRFNKITDTLLPLTFMTYPIFYGKVRDRNKGRKEGDG